MEEDGTRNNKNEVFKRIDLITDRPSLKFEVVDPPLFNKNFQNLNKRIENQKQSKTQEGIKKDSKNLTKLKKDSNEIEILRLRQKKAWDIAFGPAKQVPMQFFMIWMSGNGVQIFSVMMVYMLIKGSITGSLSVNQTFKPFQSNNKKDSPRKISTTEPKKSLRDRDGDDGFLNFNKDSLILQKLTFVICQGFLLMIGIWKVNGMGLLPTRISDWLMYQNRPVDAIRQSIELFGDSDSNNLLRGIIRN